MTSERANVETNKTQVPQNLPKDSRAKEMWEVFKEFWSEFSRIKYGIVGLVLLFVFLGIVVLEPVIVQHKDVNSKWNDITYWDTLPRAAAPAWTNWLSSEKKAVHETIEPEMSIKTVQGMQIIEGTYNYSYDYDQPPRDLNFYATAQGTINLSMKLERPDGTTIDLVQKSIRAVNEKDIVITLASESSYQALQFVKKNEDPAVVPTIKKDHVDPIHVLFAKAVPGIYKNPEALKGEYTIKLSAAVMGKNAKLENSKIIAAGRVYGLFGTDTSKRDIWSGVIAGAKWAMLIGLLTSFVSVVVGIVYGVASAYFGGWVDSLMMRFWEIFVCIPMLPVLIVISAVWKPSIWSLIFMMCAFYWRGSVKVIRSMGLQIKQETYIEAAKALDASHARILFKHMIPQLIPYSFASMALMVPGAIVSEATMSLLGLGDATIVTWGQILQGAVNDGAVLQGIWWWIVPPGLFIAFMGMTFAFIGFAMDTILNPKLKTR